MSGQRETWGGAGQVLEKGHTIIDRLVQGRLLDELHHSHDGLEKRTHVASCGRFQLKLPLTISISRVLAVRLDVSTSWP